MDMSANPCGWNQHRSGQMLPFHPGQWKSSVKAAILYSSGLRNSSPKSRMSPAESWRRTLAVMGGVSLGTIPEAADEGAGMVRWTIWSGRRMCVEATQAPVELMLRVFVSSIKSAPELSAARKKTGICKRRRGDRRRLEGSTR
jgi:hypothetical protein